MTRHLHYSISQTIGVYQSLLGISGRFDRRFSDSGEPGNPMNSYPFSFGVGGRVVGLEGGVVRSTRVDRGLSRRQPRFRPRLLGCTAAVGIATVGFTAAVGTATVGCTSAVRIATVGCTAAVGTATVGCTAAVWTATVGCTAAVGTATVSLTAAVRTVAVLAI